MGWEPTDVIDLEPQGVGDHCATARYPHQPLRRRRAQLALPELAFEPADLGHAQRALRRVEFGLQPWQVRQLRRRGEVVLLEQGADTPLTAEDARHQQQPRPQHVADVTIGVADHVRLRDQLQAVMTSRWVGRSTWRTTAPVASSVWMATVRLWRSIPDYSMEHAPSRGDHKYRVVRPRWEYQAVATDSRTNAAAAV